VDSARPRRGATAAQRVPRTAEGRPLARRGVHACLERRLAKTHNRPLPDGNKRAAYLAMIEFLARNGRRFVAADSTTTIDMMVRIAAGQVDEAEVEDWIRRQIQ
jgi:prophage maintenance system killer protein